jgi:uncharacterized protein YbjT (DUF2867 family)
MSPAAKAAERPAATLRHVVVAGATGLVGRELIRQLEGRRELSFTALVRRTGSLGAESGRVREVLFDYEDPAALARIGGDIPCDVLLCALGTTLKRAGSPEAFRKVDLDYPLALIRRAAELEAKPVFGVVSSAGAGHPRGLYLETKAAMENALVASGLPYVIVRPSLLLGDRQEFRLGERLLIGLLGRPYLGLAKWLAPQSKLVWRFAPIQAEQVARTLIRACVDEAPSACGRVLSGLQLHHPILSL